MSPNTTPNPEQPRGGLDRPAPPPPAPGALSEHDPPTDTPATNTPPLLPIIIIALLVTAIVVLHLTGVVGPASH